MNQTSARILLATGTAGILAYSVYRYRRNHTFLARARKQAEHLTENIIDAATKVRESAASTLDETRKQAKRQKKGLLHAIGAGRAAYQRAAG
jgi:hypothetical protein